MLSPERVGSRLEARIDFFLDVKALMAFYKGEMGEASEAASANSPAEQRLTTGTKKERGEPRRRERVTSA